MIVRVNIKINSQQNRHKGLAYSISVYVIIDNRMMGKGQDHLDQMGCAVKRCSRLLGKEPPLATKPQGR